MSILLEALKKSEQSRQLGETPTLRTPVDGPPPPDESSGKLVPLLLIILSATVMAWFGWQQFSMPEPADMVAEPMVASELEQQEPEGTEAVARQPRTLTEVYQGQAKPRRKTAPDEPRRKAGEKQRLKQSFDSFEAEQGSEPESAEVADTADQESAVAISDNDPEPGLTPHIAEPISYWELPQGVRDTMPEIRITVLVFAEEPGDRFLLSNGQRLVEKDEVESGLVLDEIRRDGAIFKYRKYRFLVKG
jgi:general secretion pathway protein B